MIELSSVIIGIVLLLLGLATNGWLAARHLQETALTTSEADAAPPCPESFVVRVFSRGDWEFVRGLKADGIERLFQRERKKVALVWVRQTSMMIRKAIREHAEAARHSKNLEFTTEINILAQFLMLMVVCGILSLAIEVAGPLFLSGLARFAQRLSQRVGKVQESFQAATPANTAGRTA
ncbi:MAG: hypothetical protein JWO71_4268 [Candidatus Acidoferrum typicum]|nr:hypothetical protein [Candidatus Acidoferrum typicum]